MSVLSLSLFAATGLLVGCPEELPVQMAPSPSGSAAVHTCLPPLDFVAPDQSEAIIDCTESTDTGYSSGTPFAITVVEADGKPIEVETANAYWVMKEAAAADGVDLWIVSGFRTQAEQQYFYNCYVNCNCNNCNLAATPGYSNHQSGHALDLNTSAAGVYNWLSNNGADFGFYRTVPSEDWHWEWWSGGPGGGPCGQDPECAADPNYGGCDDTVVTRCEDGHVESGDCGSYGASCSVAGGTPHCVHPVCGDDENGTGCLDATQLFICDYGALEVGDCAAFGLNCSTEGGAGHCVSPACQDDENAAFCADEDTLGLCDDGILSESSCAGSMCSTEGGAAHCGDTACVNGANAALGCNAAGALEACIDGVFTETECGLLGACHEAGAQSACISSFCVDDYNGASCAGDVAMNCVEGAVAPVNCAEVNETCSTVGGLAHCVAAACIDDEQLSICLDADTVLRCSAGQPDEIACPAGCEQGQCVDPGGPRDGGPPGGGLGEPDAGSPGGEGDGEELPPSVVEGGCNQSAPSPIGALAGLLVLFGRRRRR